MSKNLRIFVKLKALTNITHQKNFLYSLVNNLGGREIRLQLFNISANSNGGELLGVFLKESHNPANIN